MSLVEEPHRGRDLGLAKAVVTRAGNLHGFIGAIDHEEIALSLVGEGVRDRRKPQRAVRPARPSDS
jgi:hypothetical protein